MRFASRWFLLVILAIFGSTGIVHGDAGFPSLIDEGSVTLRFENLADYPAYDFYLKYGEGPGNPYADLHQIRIVPGEVIRPFKGTGRRTSVYLLAVPQGQKPPAPTGGNLSAAPDGCLQSGPLDGTYFGSGYLVPYRVRIADGKLDVTMQPREWLAGEWSLWWLKFLPCFVVPLAFCAALLGMVILIARRLRSPRPAQPPA